MGDEVLLDLLVRRIRELGGEPVVASIDPSLTRRMHGVDAVQFANVGDIARALMHCDVLVMGAAASSRTIILQPRCGVPPLCERHFRLCKADAARAATGSADNRMGQGLGR